MENVNSVCYIDVINSISPIEGADNIEQCTVEGWNSIIPKGKHKVGDKVLIIATDAVIPVKLVDLWGIGNYLRKGNRVRTVKLRGTYSECIVLPVESIHPMLLEDFEVGTDMMERLDITKWEPPVRMVSVGNGKMKKYHENPHFHIYYKFPNQKNTPDMFTEEDKVSITRKYHGANARYGFVRKNRITFFDKVKKLFGNKLAEYEFIMGSRTREKGSDSNGFYDTNVWHEACERYNLKKKLRAYAKTFSPEILGEGIIIYGEIYGKNIQGRFYNYGENIQVAFKMFDVKIDGEYQPYRIENQVAFDLQIPQVEELYTGFWNKELQDSFVYDEFIPGTSIPHEGVVVKCLSGDRAKVSKVINPDYLIFSEKNHVPDSH